MKAKRAFTIHQFSVLFLFVNLPCSSGSLCFSGQAQPHLSAREDFQNNPSIRLLVFGVNAGRAENPCRNQALSPVRQLKALPLSAGGIPRTFRRNATYTSYPSSGGVLFAARCGNQSKQDGQESRQDGNAHWRLHGLRGLPLARRQLLLMGDPLSEKCVVAQVTGALEEAVFRERQRAGNGGGDRVSQPDEDDGYAHKDQAEQPADARMQRPTRPRCRRFFPAGIDNKSLFGIPRAHPALRVFPGRLTYSCPPGLFFKTAPAYGFWLTPSTAGVKNAELQ